MSKISLLTELTSGNVADADVVAIVDNDASSTKKVKASSLYAYHLAKLAAESPARILPASAGSAGQYLQYDGTWSTPPNTTYSTMGSGNGYVAGLTPAGSATHDGDYLRKDGTFTPILGTLSTPLTTSRPTLTITKTGTSDGTFTFTVTQYMDITIAAHTHSGSSNYYWVTFSAVITALNITGHSSGTMLYDITSDLSSFGIDTSSASLTPTYFSAVAFYNKGHYPVLGHINGTVLTLPYINTGFSGDGTYAINIAGAFQYYIN